MSNKIIRTPKDLPEWFSEKDYNIQPTSMAWSDELNTRLFFSLLIKDKDRKKAEKNLEFYLTNKDATFIPHPIFEYEDIEGSIDDLTIFDTIALATFIWKPSYDPIKNAIKESIENTEEFYSQELSPLDEITCQNFTEHWVSNAVMDSIENETDFEIYSESALERFNDAHYLLKDTTLLTGYPITVDFGFDDKTIINDFCNWLKERREALGKITKTPFTEKDFNDWKKYKILEVFDLDLWSEFYGIKITDAAMAKALWPDNDPDAEEISPIDRLRKSSRKKVKELINPVSVKKILAQAAVELTALEKPDDEDDEKME